MKTRDEFVKEQINLMVADILAAGFRVFLAESGTYGFFTDEKGTKVVSFQYDLLTPSYSGNYLTDNPAQTGTGWRIAEGHNPYMIRSYFEAGPPLWAVRDCKWCFATMSDHLKRYGDSSRYQEVEREAA